MPSRNFDERRNLFLFRDSQRFQTIARPAVKEIVAAPLEMTRCDPIEILFLSAIIVRATDERDQPDWMPAQRLDQARRDFFLAIVVSDRFAKKFPPIGRAQRFERIGVEPVPADSG